MKRVETLTCVYVLRDDGIVHQTAKPGVRQELDDARANLRIFHELAGGQKRLLLVDLRKSGPTGQGVREFYAEHSVHVLASALIVGSGLSEMIGNFFIKINQPAAPTRLFTSEMAAITWLKTQQR